MSELLQSAKENVTFLLVCLVIIAAIFVVAKLVEKYCLKTVKEISQSRRIAYIAMFSVLSALLSYFTMPLPFAPSFYKLDLCEVPILINALYLGPVAGVTTELISILLKLLIKGTSTAFVGDFSNFVLGCAFVLPATVVYHMSKSKKTAVIGMAVGTVVLTAFGSVFNAFYLIPRYAALFGMPLEAIVGMGTKVNASINSVSTLVLFAVVPFNLLKGVVVSLITYLLYKRVEKLLVVRQE